MLAELVQRTGVTNPSWGWEVGGVSGGGGGRDENLTNAAAKGLETS